MKISSIPSCISDFCAHHYFAYCRRVSGCANCTKTGEFRCLPCEDKWNESYCNLTDSIFSAVLIMVCAVVLRLLMAGGNWLLKVCEITPYQQRSVYGCFIIAGLSLAGTVYLNEFRRDLLRKFLPAKHLELVIGVVIIAAILAVCLGPGMLTILMAEKDLTRECCLGAAFMLMLISLVCELSVVAITCIIISLYQLSEAIPSLIRRPVA